MHLQRGGPEACLQKQAGGQIRSAPKKPRLKSLGKFWKADDTDSVDYLADMGWKARFIPYFGLGLKIGFDL